jgi:hypothetical protein
VEMLVILWIGINFPHWANDLDVPRGLFHHFLHVTFRTSWSDVLKQKQDILTNMR